MSEIPKHNPNVIFGLILVELLNIKELMRVGRRSG